MGFVLFTVREGKMQSFSIKEILNMIGDKINDEIRIEGEAYRISTCIETGGGSTTISNDWVQIQLMVQVNMQNTFSISLLTEDYESLFLEVNHINYQFGMDYHIEGASLIWHGGFALDTTDLIMLRYPISTS